MILLDTNVLIYASTEQSPFLDWARRTIAEGVSGDGAAVSAVSLAEICVGDAEPETVADRIRSWGVWSLATADEGRFRIYFPAVTLRTP
jgi:predicted nucleic acid-binding protein